MSEPGARRQARVRQILAEIAQIGEEGALPGTVVTRSTACGKPACRCKADPPQLHGPYVSWMRSDRGKGITRKLTADQQARYRPWFDNGRRLRDLVAELEDLSVEAFDEAEGPASSGRHDLGDRAHRGPCANCGPWPGRRG